MNNILAKAWNKFKELWHVIAAILLIVALPFSMNELSSRENLRSRLDSRIAELRLENASAGGTVSEENVAQMSCLKMAREIVVSTINGGKKTDLTSLSTVRRNLEKMCDAQTLSDQNNTTGIAAIAIFPNAWPTLTLTFFIVSTCGMIGYLATAVRVSEPFSTQKAALAAILAFTFLLGIKSGYSVAFGIPQNDASANVFGLAFIGVLVGLFTEAAYERLKLIFNKATN